MAADYAIETKDLTKRFDRFVAVDRLTLQLETQRIHGFLGPNGAGKSTTFRMLCGLLSPTSGTGHVGGWDIERQAARIKENIGYMSQRFSLYTDLSVRQNLEFYAGIYKLSKTKRAERMKFVIDMAGLHERENQLAGQLSGGWRQRLALGCAILHEPRFLFLDEPTAGVDPISRRRFWDIIHDLKEAGVTILITTHYMDEAERCDTLSMIAAGRLVASAPPRELRDTASDGVLLRVDMDNPERALPALRHADGFRHAYVYGHAVRVEAASEDGAADRIRAILAPIGCVPTAVERVVPTMEDVFVALVERQGRTDEDRFEGGSAA